jgi:putative tryptophan/tyrosine transport system substrate-binding protein
MQRKFRIRFGFSWYDNRKSKIENWFGLPLSLSHSFSVRCWLGRSSQRKSRGLAILALGTLPLTGPAPRHSGIEWQSAEGNADRLPSLAAELLRLKVDVIVTNGPYSTRAAKQATVTIPIVMAAVGDPVGDGIVASLARPGGNITGLSSVVPELSGKRLELLKEIVPKLSRVAVFGSSNSPNTAGSLREVELAAGALKVKRQYLDVLSPKDIETAFREAGKGRADGVLMLVAGGVAGAHRTEIVELAVKSRLPAIYGSQAIVEAGGLMSYGVTNLDLDRRAATYVDKILKGAKPANLPVEQPKKFEFVINLKAAKQIGL